MATKDAQVKAAKVRAAKARIKVCKQDHGGPNNAATVYGHYGPGGRSCLRLHGVDVWVYDPEWEAAAKREWEQAMKQESWS